MGIKYYDEKEGGMGWKGEGMGQGGGMGDGKWVGDELGNGGSGRN